LFVLFTRSCSKGGWQILQISSNYLSAKTRRLARQLQAEGTFGLGAITRSIVTSDDSASEEDAKKAAARAIKLIGTE
jgi:hypothetical protein